MDESPEFADPTALPFAAALPYAPWWKRVAAAIIDSFVVSALGAPFVLDQITNIIENDATAGDRAYVTVVMLLVQVGYFTGLHAWRGSSIGKMALRTVVRRLDGSPIDANLAFVRAVSFAGINFISNILFLVPAIANGLRPLWHPQKQTWHDQLARTVVLSLTAPAMPAETAAPEVVDR